MPVLSALPLACGCGVREYIICMKSLNSHNLTLSMGQIHHYWLFLFSRLSKLEKETSNLESGTQTEREEEESSEAVSTCPPELRFDNIRLTC